MCYSLFRTMKPLDVNLDSRVKRRAIANLPPGWDGTRLEASSEAVDSPYRASSCQSKSVHTLILTRSWRYPRGDLFRALFFAAIPLFIGCVAAEAAIARRSPGPWINWPVLGVYALGTIYTALARLFNRTTISVETGGQLVVEHGPLPPPPIALFGNPLNGCRAVRVAVDDVQALNMSKRTIKSRSSSRAFHDLIANLRDGRTVVVVQSVDQQEEASHLIKLLARQLRRRSQEQGEADIVEAEEAEAAAVADANEQRAG